MLLSKEVLEIIVCPKCKGSLVYAESDERLRCEACRLRFRVEGDIPILLLDEAENY